LQNSTVSIFLMMSRLLLFPKFDFLI